MEEYKIKEDGSIVIVTPEQIIPAVENPVALEDVRGELNMSIDRRNNISNQIDNLQVSLDSENKKITALTDLISKVPNFDTKQVEI
jgi:hypothetical protein